MLRRNVLIFHAGALGDFVLTWPLAVALGRLHPQSRIVYVSHSQKGKLAERVLHVESADVEGGWHRLFADGEGLPGPAAKLLGGAHSVYSFVAAGGDAWASNVKRISGGAEVTCLLPRPGEEYAAHASEFLAAQLAARPAVQTAVRQILRSVAEKGLGTVRNAASVGDVVIHPGSGAAGKCWAVERFAELARRAREGGRGVRFLLGEVEAEKMAARDVDMLAGVGDVRRPGTYLDLLGELATAGLFVGNDSGPGHLAGIIGVPSVSIFGPTDEKVWRPLGPRVDVIKGESLDRVGVDAVYEKVVALAGR